MSRSQCGAGAVARANRAEEAHASTAAVMELDRQSQQVMVEKAEKRKLEERIAGMQSQLLIGGSQQSEASAYYKQLIERERRSIAQEYEERIKVRRGG